MLMDRVAVYLAVCIVQVIKPGYLQNSLKKTHYIPYVDLVKNAVNEWCHILCKSV